MNGMMLQAFEWYLPDDGNHFNFLKDNLDFLKDLGFTSIWLPPFFKGTGTNDVGYGIYDLYDLGEFDQKGSVRTKYGTKKELLDLIYIAHEKGLRVYADIVLNHKAGGDETEVFKAVKVDSNNRTIEIEEPRDIEAWTKFTFPGRQGKYSDFVWTFQHFTGVDYDHKTGDNGIFKIIWDDRDWSYSVSGENGNYDYLMFNDIDLFHPDVRQELNTWIKWLIEETGIDGMRYDALKHIDKTFVDDFTKYILSIKPDFYFVGEYWENNQGNLINFIDETNQNIDLFDVTFHYNLFSASKEGESYDLRNLMGSALKAERKMNSVTFVDNHDSQLGQSLESWVEDWFRQIAYSLVLLRKDGYPCVFFGDLYNIDSGHKYGGMRDRLIPLMELRRDYAYGSQEDFLQSPNEVGFVRMGDGDHPGRLAVAITNGPDTAVRMYVGDDQAGKTYIDKLGNNQGQVVIGDDGWADFYVSGGSVSAWVEQI